MRDKKWIVAFTAGLIIGAGFIYGITHFRIIAHAKNARGELHAGQKGLVNPLIDCSQSTFGSVPNKAELKSQIQALIQTAESENSIQSIGVYFRDLNNGPMFEINPGVHFVGASLMKLPVVIGFLKESERVPGLLTQKIVFDQEKLKGEVIFNQTIPSDQALVPGESYEVQDLLKRSIADSDNTAIVLLMKSFPDLNAFKFLKEMGVSQSENIDGLVAVDYYAGIFRILYNASYLSEDNSNRVLSWLSNSKFRKGLVEGVPQNVIVAHKFGERQEQGSEQFHHCGIVYMPGRPYLLCIMTKGTHQAQMIKTIADISKAVYEKVDRDSHSH